MNRRALYVVLVLWLSIVCFNCKSQNQNNVWYFGYNAGIDFNQTPPQPLSGGQVHTLEGVASICDVNGSLLFYTHGDTIWDRNHNIMPNGQGLGGGISSTQSAIIVPRPNSCHRFYVITVEDQFKTGRIAYSEVDMCLNNGYGDVVSSQKDVFLSSTMGEKLAAIPHTNGTDIWVVTHELTSARFKSFLVTAAGIVTNPVISTVGKVHLSNKMIGPMKASHSGTKLALELTFDNTIEMFDFNPTTGVVSNVVDVISKYGLPNNAYYGIEFSSNDQLLYVASTFASNVIYQLDLNSTNKTLLATGTAGTYDFGALQMGPDQKIYVARSGKNYLSSIDFPDVLGAGCTYTNNSFNLSPGATCQLGLPNYISAFVKQTISTYNIFLGNDTLLSCNDSLLVLSVEDDCNATFIWQDGSTDSSFVVTSPGVYWVEATNLCGTDRDSIMVSFNSPNTTPAITVSNDTICFGDSATISVAGTAVSYSWSNGMTTQIISVSPITQQTYTVQVSDGQCLSLPASTTIYVEQLPSVAVNSPPPICQGDSVILTAIGGVTYSWSNGQTNSSIVVQPLTSANYLVIANNGFCNSVPAQVSINVIPLPVASIMANDSVCLGDFEVISVSGGNTYSWSTGNTGSTISVNPIATTTYTVTPFANGCAGTPVSHTMNVVSLPNPIISGDSTLCNNETTILSSAISQNYFWNTCATTQSINVSQGGWYWLQVVENGCSNVDSLFVTKTQINENIGSDTSVCAFQYQLNSQIQNAQYLWSNGSTSQSINVNNSGVYWVQVTQNGCIENDTIALQLGVLAVSLGSDIDVCNDQVVISSPIFGTSYLWSTGETTQSISATNSGNYWVQVNQNTCSGIDTVLVTLNIPPVINLGLDSVFCNSVNLLLDAGNPGADYQWSNGGIAQSNLIQTPGVFWVEVNTGKCVGYDTINITLFNPEIDFVLGGSLCENEEVYIYTSGNAQDYLWSTGDTATFIIVTDTGKYWVTAKSGSCEVKDTIEIYESIGGSTLYIPNCFTPNDDLHNNIFKAYSTGVTDLIISIYDRWGEKIYTINGVNDYWDGTINGKKAPLGVYVYRAVYKDDCNKDREFTQTGHVSLIR